MFVFGVCKPTELNVLTKETSVTDYHVSFIDNILYTIFKKIRIMGKIEMLLKKYIIQGRM